MILTFDVLPDMRLSTNARDKLDPLQRVRLTREAKEMWWGLILEQVRRRPDFKAPWFNRASLTYTLTFPDKRHRDGDNLLGALKPITDVLGCPRSVRDAYKLWVILDDSTEYLRINPVQVRYEKGVSRTDIELEEIRP